MAEAGCFFYYINQKLIPVRKGVDHPSKAYGIRHRICSYFYGSIQKELKKKGE